MKRTPRDLRLRRHNRIRRRVHGSTQRPRLCVFRSNMHIYAQIIDDTIGHTLVTASTTEKDIRGAANGQDKTALSQLVGKRVAERALSAGITQVVFDRGGYKYHGRVKALAEAAREVGLKF